MPRGFAYLYSTLSNKEMFGCIESHLRKRGIQLEIPGTDNVQMWNSEGEMIQLHKKELSNILPDISKYLIQFWWSEMNDISIKINNEDYLNECDFYLDGLDDSQLKDILRMLLVIMSESINDNEFKGFVVDRFELSSEYDWKTFFRDDTCSINSIMEYCGLYKCKKYDLGAIREINTSGLKENIIYVAQCDKKTNKFILYMLQQ